MSRQDIYKVIDSERDYQEKKWGEDNKHEIAAYLSYMHHQLNKAIEIVSTQSPETGALEYIRKLTALGVACMEEHGAHFREPVTMEKKYVVDSKAALNWWYRLSPLQRDEYSWHFMKRKETINTGEVESLYSSMLSEQEKKPITQFIVARSTTEGREYIARNNFDVKKWGIITKEDDVRGRVVTRYLTAGFGISPNLIRYVQSRVKESK